MDSLHPTSANFDATYAEEDGKDMYNYVRSLKPDILINNRVGKGRMGMEGLNPNSTPHPSILIKLEIDRRTHV